jgi:hypothetical protein
MPKPEPETSVLVAALRDRDIEAEAFERYETAILFRPRPGRVWIRPGSGRKSSRLILVSLDVPDQWAAWDELWQVTGLEERLTRGSANGSPFCSP